MNPRANASDEFPGHPTPGRPISLSQSSCRPYDRAGTGDVTRLFESFQPGGRREEKSQPNRTDLPWVVSQYGDSNPWDPVDGRIPDNTDTGTAHRRNQEGTGNRTSDATLPEVTPARQVLIVGDTIPGLALATFLERSGHDPVLLQTPGGRHPSTITTVWAPALDLLDVEDIDDALRTAGRFLDAVTVRQSNGSATEQRLLSADADQAVPLVIGTKALRDVLRDRIGPETTLLSSQITGVSDRSNAIEVEFESGVRESFDLVIGADGPESSVRSGTDGDLPQWTTVAQMEGVLRHADDSTTTVLDNWWDDAFGQLVPSPTTDGENIVRLTTAESNGFDDGRATEIARSMLSVSDLEADGEAVSVHPLGSDRTHVYQADSGTGSWGDGRVAYCGSAAFPVPPATGLQTGLAVEDAWVLADELSRRQGSAVDVVNTYGQRRRRRIRTIHRRSSAAHSHHSYPLARTEPLTTLSQGRTTTLGPHCAVSLAELQEEVPNRL
jgi:2-polyprenyl-6-methoxyphenol hydroxylase-like FAD-dependent oxidoreductase